MIKCANSFKLLFISLINGQAIYFKDMIFACQNPPHYVRFVIYFIAEGVYVEHFGDGACEMCHFSQVFPSSCHISTLLYSREVSYVSF